MLVPMRSGMEGRGGGIKRGVKLVEEFVVLGKKRRK